MSERLRPLAGRSLLLAANGFAEGPALAARDFLLRCGAGRVVTVLHPLGPEDGNRHWILDEDSAGGRQERSIRLPSRPPYTYPLDVVVPLRPPAVDVWLGFNALACGRGLVARRLGRASQVVYWCVDYVDDRFGRSPLTQAYLALDGLCSRRADARFELSTAALEARNTRHARSGPLAPAHVVPMGAWLDRVQTTTVDNHAARRLVFLGHLVERQGVATLLQAIRQLRDRSELVRVDIIGKGPEQERLRRLAGQLSVGDLVRFHGFVPDFRAVESLLAAATVAVAPYVDVPGSFTRYADPGKLKAYLAAGLPIVMTPVPPNARELAEAGAAIVVPDDATALADAISALLGDRAGWERRRRAALEEARRHDWSVILEEAFAVLGYRARPDAARVVEPPAFA